MLKPDEPTSLKVIKACFLAIVSLEKERLFQEPMQKDDDISFNRARNELYSVLDSNGCKVEWVKGQYARLIKGGTTVLTSQAH